MPRIPMYCMCKCVPMNHSQTKSRPKSQIKKNIVIELAELIYAECVRVRVYGVYSFTQQQYIHQLRWASFWATRTLTVIYLRTIYYDTYMWAFNVHNYKYLRAKSESNRIFIRWILDVQYYDINNNNLYRPQIRSDIECHWAFSWLVVDSCSWILFATKNSYIRIVNSRVVCSRWKY